MDIRQIEAQIERSLRPGIFIYYRASFGFVRGLEKTAGLVDCLMKEGQPRLASSLYELFIKACYEKASEVDDSGGCFGDFIAMLFTRWVEARQAFRADPKETVDFLLAWMEDDPYGFCYDLEKYIAGKMEEGLLSLFVQKVRQMLDASPPDDGGGKGYPRRRWTKVLKHVFEVRGDVDAYISICELEDLNSGDCHVIAGILERKGLYNDALKWVDRGLSSVTAHMRSAEFDLVKRRRALLIRLGRIDEAIDHSWYAFLSSPSKYSYNDLMELIPEDNRRMWHGRAMAVAERADLQPAVDLFMEIGELERLEARFNRASDDEIRQAYYSVMVEAAEYLSKSYHSTAARIYAQLGSHILDERKTKLYRTALRYFELARDLYTDSGKADEWDKLVVNIKKAHRRKQSFMPGFERVAAGGPAKEPKSSLIERAKRNW